MSIIEAEFCGDNPAMMTTADGDYKQTNFSKDE